MECKEKVVYYCTKESFIAKSTDRIVQVDLRKNKEELNEFFGQPLRKYEEYMQAVINGTWEDYVIYDGDRIVARAAIWWFDNSYGDITAVETKKEYRNQGMATELVSCLTKIILDRGKYPTISTHVDNSSMRHVIEKVGYVAE